MFDTSDLLRLLQQATQETMEASQLTDVVFGNVISDNPLKIQIEQKLTLTEKQLLLCRNVTDYETEISVDMGYGWITEDTQNGTKLQSLSLAQNHKHDIKLAKKKIKIHNALKTGERVILVRLSGGQRYLVLDRTEVK